MCVCCCSSMKSALAWSLNVKWLVRVWSTEGDFLCAMLPLQIISIYSLSVGALGDGWLSITFPGIPAFGMSISLCTAVAPQGRPGVVGVSCTNWIWNPVNETGSSSIFHWASALKLTKSCRDLVKENDLMVLCFSWISRFSLGSMHCLF